MYLKKIEFNGFKSFAEKTELVIPPGVTAIVGPNGCGKTNVVDAISWVLGEQSAKQLRGYKMEDVIFNGTTARQAVGMAEVSLTFDNADGTLPLDFSEVTLTRRVFRSGEGQYFINRKPCRLRDINELVLGTGLGNRSYSLVGQGRIDQVLRSRPEERRFLLEEAAGISKYRKKREEALRKLEHTQNNLLRIDDIIREVKRQLAVAERQTRQAEQYRKHRERLRELEIALGLLKLEEIRRVEQESGAEREGLESSYRGLQDRATELEEKLSRLRRDLKKEEDAFHQARSAQITGRAEIDKAGHRRELNRRQIGDIQNHVQRLIGEKEKTARDLEEGRKTAVALEGELGKLAAANREQEAELERREAELRGLVGRLDEAQRQAADYRNRLLENSRAEARLNNEYAGVEAGSKELVLRKRRLAVQIERLEEAGKEQEEEQVSASEVIEEREAEMRRLKEELKTASAAASAAAEAHRAAVARRDEQVLALKVKESRDRLLRDSETFPGEGADGIKCLLDAGEDRFPSRAGIVGLLADFIEVDSGFEALLEALLGDKERALVVEDRATAEAAATLLRDAQAGRTVLLVRSRLEPREPASAEIYRHIRFSGPMKGLETAVLGVPDPSAGAAGFRVIAPGTVERSDGSVIWAGTASSSGRIYSRSRMLEELSAEIAAATGALEQAELERSAAERDREEKDAFLRDLSIRLRDGELAQAIASRESDRLKKGLEQVRLELAGARREVEEIESDLVRLSGRKNELEAKLTKDPVRSEDGARGLKDAEAASARIGSEVREAERGITGLKIALASSREREDSLSTRLKMLKRELAGHEAALTSREEQITAGRDRVSELERENDELAGEIELRSRELEEGTAGIERLRLSVEEWERRCTDAEKEYQNVRPSLQEAQEKVGQVEVRLAEARLRRNNISQRIREAYGVELEALEVPEGDFDQDAMAGEAESIKEKMAKMTNINLAALEDKEVFDARLKLLLEQKEDLESARIHIEEAIRKINITARERLAATFDIVRNSFRDIFRQLFEGGKADLVLDNEKDILDSGLEIVAQPPGKKLQHINLLSGGERAMTTIAFIFALFKVQPSPFYLLDEIDAPLDGVNISRFVHLLKSRSGEAQFIIITHNKQTIAEADVLYGITMEESGVSKVVSVKFSPEKTEA
ncbi:MAG TPA: chromosome segregation protein SMC [bacterium]|nr:chromosome segregation protein SMC [bacterium]